MQEQHSPFGSQEQRAGRDRRSNSGNSNYTGPERRCSPDRRRTRTTDTTYFEWASLFLGRHELGAGDNTPNCDMPLLDSGAI